MLAGVRRGGAICPSVVPLWGLELSRRLRCGQLCLHSPLGTEEQVPDHGAKQLKPPSYAAWRMHVSEAARSRAGCAPVSGTGWNGRAQSQLRGGRAPSRCSKVRLRRERYISWVRRSCPICRCCSALPCSSPASQRSQLKKALFDGAYQPSPCWLCTWETLPYSRAAGNPRAWRRRSCKQPPC